MRTTIGLFAVFAVLAGVSSAEQVPPPQPTFRIGVDVVQLDVSVLDAQRHPVRGLTADYFTILENGKPRRIVAFTAVELAAPAMTRRG